MLYTRLLLLLLPLPRRVVVRTRGSKNIPARALNFPITLQPDHTSPHHHRFFSCRWLLLAAAQTISARADQTHYRLNIIINRYSVLEAMIGKSSEECLEELQNKLIACSSDGYVEQDVSNALHCDSQSPICPAILIVWAVCSLSTPRIISQFNLSSRGQSLIDLWRLLAGSLRLYS